MEGGSITLTTGNRFLRTTSKTTRRDSKHPQCYDCFLTIENIKSSDSKEYTLEVSNEEGRIIKSININVVDELFNLELLVSMVIGGVLSILIVSLVILYSLQARRSSDLFRNIKITNARKDAGHKNMSNAGSIHPYSQQQRDLCQSSKPDLVSSYHLADQV